MFCESKNYEGFQIESKNYKQNRIMKKQIVKIGLMALAITFISVDANAQKKKKKN